ncbi:MAG: hypothetical protein GWP61_17245 [Chloroflexi bacterium]|nr:hypothetical protein [Chloroflexota bacterium]
MQGQLRNEALDFIIASKCSQSGRTIHIEMDGELNYRVQESDAEPMLSVPMVDIGSLKDPSIIDAF